MLLVHMKLGLNTSHADYFGLTREMPHRKADCSARCMHQGCSLATAAATSRQQTFIVTTITSANLPRHDPLRLLAPLHSVRRTDRARQRGCPPRLRLDAG